MSRRMIKGEPSPETLRKRRYRARRRREDDPVAFYLLRHRRKEARRASQQLGSRPFDMDEIVATQPKTIEEWLAVMSIGE